MQQFSGFALSSKAWVVAQLEQYPAVAQTYAVDVVDDSCYHAQEVLDTGQVKVAQGTAYRRNGVCRLLMIGG